MGICTSCYDNNNDQQNEQDNNGEEKEETVQDCQEADVLVHHVQQDQHDQPVDQPDHHGHHHQPRGGKSLCRKCNLRLLTLIHLPPPKADTAAAAAAAEEEKSEELQAEKNLGDKPSTSHLPPSTSHLGENVLQISKAGDNTEQMEAANPELRRNPRKPHRDLHVSWRKGHGDFIDHLMFGWHH